MNRIKIPKIRCEFLAQGSNIRSNGFKVTPFSIYFDVGELEKSWEERHCFPWLYLNFCMSAPVKNICRATNKNILATRKNISERCHQEMFVDGPEWAGSQPTLGGADHQSLPQICEFIILIHGYFPSSSQTNCPI